MTEPVPLPTVRLKIARRSAHPWICQKMVEKPATRLAPGSVVDILDRDPQSPPATCTAWLAAYNDFMSTISVQEIQRNPLAFLQRIEAGEAFVVVQGERLLAEVHPLAGSAAAQPRPFGLCAGRFTVPVGFDQPLPDSILKEFEGA